MGGGVCMALCGGCGGGGGISARRFYYPPPPANESPVAQADGYGGTNTCNPLRGNDSVFCDAPKILPAASRWPQLAPGTTKSPCHAPPSVDRNSKSTAIHAGVVSPDAHICTYPDLGCDLDPETTLLVYPTPDSHALSEVPDLPKFKNVVVVEATWQQSKYCTPHARRLGWAQAVYLPVFTGFWAPGPKIV